MSAPSHLPVFGEGGVGLFLDAAAWGEADPTLPSPKTGRETSGTF